MPDFTRVCYRFLALFLTNKNHTNMKKVIITFAVCIFAWGLFMIPTGLKLVSIITIALCAGSITAAVLLITVALCKMASENEKEEQNNIIDKK